MWYFYEYHYKHYQHFFSLFRCYVSVVLLNNTIYAMGGFDGHHRLGSAEKYNFERNQWTLIAPMTTQRSDACAAVLNSKYDNKNKIDERFDRCPVPISLSVQFTVTD